MTFLTFEPSMDGCAYFAGNQDAPPLETWVLHDPNKSAHLFAQFHPAMAPRLLPVYLDTAQPDGGMDVPINV